MLAGCGRGQRSFPVRPVNGARPPAPRPLSEVFVLENGSAAPEDTTVTITDSTDRFITMRRGAPDYTLFAELRIPAGTLAPPPGGEAAIQIRPRPGIYGVDIDVKGTLGPGAELLFSYAVQFVAPGGARARYRSDLNFERALMLGTVDSTGRVTFLPTTRPGSDIVKAVIPGPGRYLVVAPR
jgi:hypothetical protein